MVLLILPDQSGTPETTAGFLLCWQKPARVGAAARPSSTAGALQHCPRPLESCWISRDNLTRAYELRYSGLNLFYVGSRKWTPNTVKLFPSTKAQASHRRWHLLLLYWNAFS